MIEFIWSAVVILTPPMCAIIAWESGDVWRSGFCAGIALMAVTYRAFDWWEKRKKPAEPA